MVSIVLLLIVFLEVKEIHIFHYLDLHVEISRYFISAVEFMWDNVIESMENFKAKKDSGGNGCIVAHCMGLGKTLSVSNPVFSFNANVDCVILFKVNSLK